MPDDARAQFEAGVANLAAAQTPVDFALAARDFTRARKLAPASPLILYEQAYSEDSAGRILRAIALYNAYLAASPQAENAADVRGRISQLEDEQKAQIDSLLDQLEGLSAELPEENKESEQEEIARQRSELAELGQYRCFDPIMINQQEETIKKIRHWTLGLDSGSSDFSFTPNTTAPPFDVRDAGGKFVTTAQSIPLDGEMHTDFGAFIASDRERYLVKGIGMPDWTVRLLFYHRIVDVLIADLSCMKQLQDLYR